jgi:filamentous hemagglutinin family protein
MHSRHSPASALPISGKKSNIIGCLPLPLSVVVACLYSSSVHALPQDPSVASGTVSITTADRAMQITQTTNKAIIDWTKFGIAFNESVTFNQPSRSSVVLNRVTGAESSALDGVLNATGQVFLINPNGVLIGPTARVTVGGLLASTMNIENQRFLNSDYTFTARSNADDAPVANAGAIKAVDGGYVVMLANNVRNNGMIDAPSGHVLMGAGSQAVLYISNQSLLGYRIDTGTAAALVENAGRITADSGKVSLAARGLSGASELASAAVNNSGIIEARTLNGKPGAIVLSGDMQSGRVSLTGKLDASAQAGQGGTIDTSASVVSVGSVASVSTGSQSGTTGLWTSTSSNPSIGQAQDNISNTALSSTLEKSNVTIVASKSGEEKSGVLSVDAEIAAHGKNRLVLKAANNLLVNAPVTVGSGGLVAYADSNGTGDGKVRFAADATVGASDGAPIDIYTNVSSYKDTSGYEGFITSPYRLWMLVNNVHQLQDLQTNLSGNYALGRDIDAAETASWNGGAGFRPLGFDGRPFAGQLDGMNHVISSLTIHRPRNDFIGLFSELTGSVRNLGLSDIHVTANSHAGAFAGNNGGTLNNVYATGSVSVEVEAGYSEQATATAGGLVGSNDKNGLIRDAYSLVDVGGRWVLGGIAGTNDGVIEGVYAAGKVGSAAGGDSFFQFGGLVGNNNGQVRNAYWTNDGTGKNLAFGRDASPVGTPNSISMLTNEGLRNANLGLDFDSIWFRYDGYTAPLLRSFLKPLTISGISRQIDKVYDGLAFDFQPGFVYSSPEAALSAHLNSSGDATVGKQGQDVGAYTSRSATTFWSDQQGYLIQQPVVEQSATVAISARPITVQAYADTKLFDNSADSSVSPGVSPSKSQSNLGLANGDTLNANQAFDSSQAGDRTLAISSLEIKNSAGKDVTSNYQVISRDASGTIVAVKPDPKPEPNPNPKPNPNPNPNPNPGPGANPAPDQSHGSGQGGTSGPSGIPVPGKTPGAAAGGSRDGTKDSPTGTAGEQQRRATLFAYLGTQDEDEMMKKSLRNKKLKNDFTFSIRNGGMHVPGEVFKEE